MFSQVGKAGAEALYQWAFSGDAQYGELDDQTGNTRLSYWVDYWLAHMFPGEPWREPAAVQQLRHNGSGDASRSQS